jgi:DNA-binding beta-propeller fold protein YncE
MGHIPRSLRPLLAALLVLAATGCGEPLVVLGDAPGIMRIIIGVGDTAGARVDSLAARTRLTEPTAVTFDPASGRVYAADRGALVQAGGISRRVARIFAVTSAGRSTLLLGERPCTPAPCIEQATSMVVAPDGSLIIADAMGHRVLRFAPGGALTVLAGTGVRATTPDGGGATVASLDQPAGVALSNDGRIFVAESGANRVRWIDAAGVLRTYAGTGVPGHAGDGGPALAAQLHSPSGLAFHDGVLYIAEQGTHVVRAVDGNGTIRTVAGTAFSQGFAGDGGPAASARLDRPVAVTTAPHGAALYISDRGNNRVRIVELGSGVIRTFAGTGERRYTGARLTAGQTSLSEPADVHATQGGFLFIVDSGHAVVWRTALGF